MVESTISATTVNRLRTTTGAPLMKCKAALVAANGDLARAKTILRGEGVNSTPTQQAGNQGYIAVYAHPGNQIVALVELACTTDFVARSTEFRTVAEELAMQVAASAPTAISMDDITPEHRESEINIAHNQLAADPKMANKPEPMLKEIARNKAMKNLEEQCLLTQAHIRNPKVKVATLIDDLKLRVREGIYIRRIARWRVGENL